MLGVNMKSKKGLDIKDDWAEVLKEESSLYMVSTDFEVIVKNNRFAFSKETADKMFEQSMNGFNSMLRDMSVSEKEKQEIVNAVYNLRITPFRYH